MPYGELRVDTITFTNGGVDKSITVSGLFASTSGNLTVTGTVSGTTANFVSGNFTTQLSGATITGNTGQFSNITGISGVFTTRISGATITGTNVLATTGSFTSLTGTTTTGTTANFATGVFSSSISGATITATSGVIASGTAAAPTLSISGDADTGLYSPAANQISITTSGTERLRIDDAGQIEATNIGSATAPTFSFTGDPNTGIYSPGADQLAISTGGSGRLFINSAGNAVIGSSTAQAFSGYTTLTVDNATNGGVLCINKNAVNVGNISATNDALTLDAANGGSSPIVFRTGAATTERVRITSAGLVGIGTSSPGSLLDLVGGDIRLNSVYGINKSNADGYIHLSGGTSNVLGGAIFCFGQSHISNANEIHFRNSGNQTRVVIDSSGRLGIGATAPTAPLSFSSSVGQKIDLYSGAAGNEFGFGIEANELRICSGTGSSIGFRTGGYSGSERARIDSAGRLLVGTSSESGNSLLTVRGNTGSATGAGVLDIGLGTTRPGSAGTPIGYIRFTSTSNTSSNYHYASIAVESDGTSSSDTDIPGRLVFSTTADGASSPTERMRISQEGTVDVYGTPTDAEFTARVSHGAGTSYGLISGRHSASSTATGINSFYVYTNGNVVNTNGSYGVLSDIKLKENIVDAKSQWADIKTLRIRNYNFKEETGQQTHTQIGLVAQEVELVSPGLVSESPDRDEEGNELGTVTKSVNQSVLYMKAVKALQEAMERIETLEAKVAALEGA